jgi:hypothetical protein
MPPRNTDKNKDVLKDLEKTISPVLVVNNASLKPYVELFEYEPENIYQQPLGSLVGFFEIKEYSDESAYIVNFLTSVLKKEYYINPKRQVTESLDSALHKVNMALSELAKNGNVEWLGKINAAICVLEKNNTHFSVAGNAKIFLYRNLTLSEISADLAPENDDPHPLKTFVNVSSGRLEKSDRILITSEDIFHILSILEIKKNFQRFQGDKFVQFLKTALSNQMEMIASIVVEMTESMPTIISKSSNKKTDRVMNAFSGTAFADLPKENLPSEETIENLMANEEQTIEQAIYTDKKTGHIYIQGEANENIVTTGTQIAPYLDMMKEKFSHGSHVAKNEIRKRFSLYKKQLAKKSEARRIQKEEIEKIRQQEAEAAAAQQVIEEMQRQQEAALELEAENIRLEEERIEQEKAAVEAAELEKQSHKKSRAKLDKLVNSTELGQKTHELSFQEKLLLAKKEQQRSAVIDLRIKERNNEIEPIFTETKETEETIELPIHALLSEKKPTRIDELKDIALNFSASVLTKGKEKYTKLTTKNIGISVVENNIGKTIPHISKIKALYSRFTFEQKIYTIGALILIFIVPLFIVHFINAPKAPTISDIQIEAPVQSETLSKEKNINLNVKAQSIYTNSNIVEILLANGNPTIITNKSIVVMQNGQSKEFSIPDQSGTPIKAAYMNDLSLVLVLTDNNKVISFNAISNKFSDNKIELTNISTESFIGTYLTYLYVLDQKSNQIYRYPRADGGFGDKLDWFKDSTQLSSISAMTIDDNVYVIKNDEVLKFFKGKTVAINFEKANTPIKFDKIYTNTNLQSIYVIDKENSRLIAFSKEGNILAQYKNESIGKATALTVDEQTKTAYIATPSELISISL